MRSSAFAASFVAIIIALGSAETLATADSRDQVVRASNDDLALVEPIFSTEETTGSIDRTEMPQGLPLSDEQRSVIFLAVINTPDVPEIDIPLPDLTSAVAEGVELHDLPVMVTRQIPLLHDFKFVKLDDRILVVRPDDRTVVSEIPRYRLAP